MITGLPWDLEERVEDAFVAHIKTAIGERCMIKAAREVFTAKFPLIVVEAQSSDNVSDEAQFNGKRRMNVLVALTTEAVNYPETGQPEWMRNARENHRAVKSQMIEALASAKLQDYLNAAGVPGVIFSMAHMTQQNRDVGEGKIITEQTMDVIANPLEI